MEHIIDYAGLFPPARLEMRPTVRNYAAYLAGEHAWMLGRLIVPMQRLAEFEEGARALLPRSEDDVPWQISALTSPAEDADALERDLDAIDAFNDHHADSTNGLAVIDAIELRASGSAAIEEAIDMTPDTITPFFELALESDLRGMLLAIAGNDACAKVRTGGVTADLFPAPGAVASFIALCATADVPFKATAGLHHPFTHRSKTVEGAAEFGFINLFLAAVLARRERLPGEQLAALLEDQDVASFAFCDDRIAWRSHEVAEEEIDEARRTFALSYGSCSFVEPIEDLAAAKLLP